MTPYEQFLEALEAARAALQHIENSREKSLAATKLDEAELWGTRLAGITVTPDATAVRRLQGEQTQ